MPASSSKSGKAGQYGSALEIVNKADRGGDDLFILPYLRLIAQNRVEQRAVHFDLAVVADEAFFSKFVHEIAYARSSSADHFCERLLTDLCDDWLRPAFLAKIGQQKQQPG